MLRVLFALLLALFLFVPKTWTAETSSLKLFLEAAPVFDLVCQEKTNFKIDQKWQLEFIQKEKFFQNAWDEKASSIATLSEQIAGRSFTRKEYSVALVLCKWTPMGLPFIVSVRPFLDSSAEADEALKTPLSMHAFVSMTHHELLHNLVDNLLTEDFWNFSTLLSKYSKEPFNVLVHLHLIALQKAVYEKMGDQDLLKNTEILYKFIGGDYLRAWDIVNDEGAEPFTKELQAFNSGQY